MFTFSFLLLIFIFSLRKKISNGCFLLLLSPSFCIYIFARPLQEYLPRASHKPFFSSTWTQQQTFHSKPQKFYLQKVFSWIVKISFPIILFFFFWKSSKLNFSLERPYSCTFPFSFFWEEIFFPNPILSFLIRLFCEMLLVFVSKPYLIFFPEWSRSFTVCWSES